MPIMLLPRYKIILAWPSTTAGARAGAAAAV
jgi:hypothetical protein